MTEVTQICKNELFSVFLRLLHNFGPGFYFFLVPCRGSFGFLHSLTTAFWGSGIIMTSRNKRGLGTISTRKNIPHVLCRHCDLRVFASRSFFCCLNEIILRMLQCQQYKSAFDAMHGMNRILHQFRMSISNHLKIILIVGLHLVDSPFSASAIFHFFCFFVRIIVFKLETQYCLVWLSSVSSKVFRAPTCILPNA